MNYITTTQLRTQVPSLIETLLMGKAVDLIHRSQKIGTLMLEPAAVKKTDHARLTKNIALLKLPYLTKNQMKNNYDEHIRSKYGQSLS